ncbi:hypothetical protein [Psychroserpens sp. NJDZ02]|uniref:hypothetical protein n=1 Tax=Psychroserpens sp. NJDZ02 TaxID=2570561 RepID=UPI0010A8BBC6|nr:hypothetical protein [Psychroserpens sp. NJDZ02]QCE41201.1 hypothetical protein E9099_07160 [Psychroserpens sp. NJDZ02]
MKHITIVLLCIIALSCKEEKRKIATPKNTKTETTTTNQKKIEPVETVEKNSTIAFLDNIKSLKHDTSSNPIATFKTEASTSAKKIISLNKANINAALDKAKKFKYAVITVENHTIVKLDLHDCKPSGSWSACMPKAEGYIKKGELIYQNDYANNIIGLPGRQDCQLYLF